MIITSTRIKGDNMIVLNGDDGKTYHFLNGETAQDWMKQYTTNVPTLASISPATAVSVSGADLTVTLTGTNFNTNNSEVLVNGVPYTRAFVSATSMTILVKPSLVPGPTYWSIWVRNNGVFETVAKTFTFT